MSRLTWVVLLICATFLIAHAATSTYGFFIGNLFVVIWAAAAYKTIRLRNTRTDRVT